MTYISPSVGLSSLYSFLNSPSSVLNLQVKWTGWHMGIHLWKLHWRIRNKYYPWIFQVLNILDKRCIKYRCWRVSEIKKWFVCVFLIGETFLQKDGLTDKIRERLNHPKPLPEAGGRYEYSKDSWKHTSTKPSLFGETFRRTSQSIQVIYRGDGLCDTSTGECKAFWDSQVIGEGISLEKKRQRLWWFEFREFRGHNT